MPSTLTSIAAMRVKRTCGIVALLGNSPDDAKTGNSCVFSILLQGSRGRPTLALPPAARRVLSDDTWQEAQVRREKRCSARVLSSGTTLATGIIRIRAFDGGRHRAFRDHPYDAGNAATWLDPVPDALINRILETLI